MQSLALLGLIFLVAVEASVIVSEKIMEIFRYIIPKMQLKK